MLRPLAIALLVTGCGARPQPYRFASPMLGTASVPAPRLPAGTPPAPAIGNHERRAEPLRVAANGRVHEATAPRVREASAAAAAAILDAPVAHVETRAQLPAPNRTDVPQPPQSPIHVPADLRALVGRRDAREPNAAALGWAYDLGTTIDGDVVAWAEAAGRLHDASEPPERGDLLVFDKVNSDNPADLIGIVVARDERSVTEFVYLGGGVIRRGFVDASRPATRRDKSGAVVNTFLRTGKRWPIKGTHYLAGEHLAHLIR